MELGSADRQSRGHGGLQQCLSYPRQRFAGMTGAEPPLPRAGEVGSTARCPSRAHLVNSAWSSPRGMGSTGCFAFSCISPSLSLLDSAGTLNGQKQRDWICQKGEESRTVKGEDK